MTWQSVLSDWSFEPTVLIGFALAAVLYWRGMHRAPALMRNGRRVMSLWKPVAFYGGLLVVFLALESPIDTLGATLFWAHMTQHVLLIMVGAPLIVLGDPLMPLLRGVPLAPRRRAIGFTVRQRWVHRLGAAFGWIASPVPAVTIFLLDLYIWHWNFLFNLTLRNQVVHDLEHLCFLGTAALFWTQVIDQRPMRSRLSYTRRAVYTLVAAGLGNILAMFFVFSLRPDYSQYARVTHRLFGISALADQQFAGAIMWVPVLFLFGGAFVICFFKALSEDESSTIEAAGSYSVLLPREQAR